MLIDTHAHLTAPDYTDITAVIARAKAAGVTRFVVPGFDLTSSRQAVDLRQTYPEVYPAVGLHPTNPDENFDEFRALAALPAVYTIGEVGTDKHGGPMEEQEKRFRFFIELALETAKPLIIHTRDTWDDTFRILKDYPELKNNAVIHCFTGGEAEAKRIQELELFLSCTAILTRPKLESTREVIKTWPLERLMLETDCPWLAWPGENWPNEPKAVAKVAQLIAEVKEISLGEVAKITTQTAEHFFDLLSL